uniref:tRNA selenocysteine 1-associated protein 1 n=1 Tax=Syphacia muris TaxID=451379 RepID=A0A0N5AWA4_9BILA
MASRPFDDTDRTLWMGDLDSSWDTNYIAEAFSRMGEEVLNVKIVFDKRSGKPYCFVEFCDQESARRAMLHINGKPIPKSNPPSVFNLSFANSPTASYTEYNLFVNNVPHNMDNASLFLIFGERYRSCRGAKVYRNLDGSSKSQGFVRFSDQTDQQRALLEMNKYRVDGKQLLLKLAPPKHKAPRQNRQQLQMNYDSTPYYRSPQENSTVRGSYGDLNVNTAAAYQNNFASTSYNYSQVEVGPQTQPICYPVVEGGAITAYESYGVAPVGDITASESNEQLLENGEELYNALEECRWSKVVLDANDRKNLLRSLTEKMLS